MVNKRFLLSILLMMLSLSVFAAKDAKKGKNKLSKRLTEPEPVIEEEEEVKEIKADEEWQQLEWTEDNPDYVLYYEIVIEQLVKNEEGEEEYTEVLRKFTEDNTTNFQLQPPLPPGSYRYRIVTYDLIEMPAVESDWFNFVIYRAYQPVIEKIASSISFTNIVYLEEENDGVFTLSGENLFLPQENPDDTEYSTYEFRNVMPFSPVIVPEILEHDENNKRIKLQIPLENMEEVGRYRFIITDKSGLKTGKGAPNEIIVRFRKAMDIDFSLGWASMFMIPWETNVTQPNGSVNSVSFTDYFGTGWFPIGGTGRVTVVPFKTVLGYFGLGFWAAGYNLKYVTDGYTLTSAAATISGIVTYQQYLYKHKLLLDLHGGIGLTGFFNMRFSYPEVNIKTKPLNALKPSFSGGIALQYYIWNRFYIEVGADIIWSINLSDLSFNKKENSSDIMLMYVQPAISVGWQF